MLLDLLHQVVVTDAQGGNDAARPLLGILSIRRLEVVHGDAGCVQGVQDAQGRLDYRSHPCRQQPECSLPVGLLIGLDLQKACVESLLGIWTMSAVVPLQPSRMGLCQAPDKKYTNISVKSGLGKVVCPEASASNQVSAHQCLEHACRVCGGRACTSLARHMCQKYERCMVDWPITCAPHFEVLVHPIIAASSGKLHVALDERLSWPVLLSPESTSGDNSQIVFFTICDAGQYKSGYHPVALGSINPRHMLGGHTFCC